MDHDDIYIKVIKKISEQQLKDKYELSSEIYKQN